MEEGLAYIASLKFKPDGTRTTIEEAEADAPQADDRGGSSPPAVKKSGRRMKPSKVSDKLFPSGLHCEHDKLKLTLMLDEGKRMKVETAPHAAAFLLRSSLEIALTVSLKHHKLFGKITPSNPKHGPSLNDMLDYVNKNPASLGLDAQEKTVMEALVSRNVKQSKAQLDRIVHGTDVTTTKEEIISIRELALPILSKILSKKL